MSARKAFEKYRIEINSHNFDRLVPLISEECNFWFPTGIYHGLPEARKGFEKIWSVINEKKSALPEPNWIVEADRSAVCTYDFYWSGIINGQKIYEKGFGTTCFRLEAKAWKIIHEQLSHSPHDPNTSVHLPYFWN